MVASRHSLDDARVVHKEAYSLRDAGHEVILLLSCNERFEYTRHDGRVLAAGTAPDGEACHEGFRVVGRPKRRGAVGKWRSYRELSELAARLEADVYHAHEPDLALAVALRARGLAASRGHRASVVHDMHEYPPGEVVDQLPGWGKGPAHLALVARDRLMNRGVDHIFTANAVIREYAQVQARRTGRRAHTTAPRFASSLSRPSRGGRAGAPASLCHTRARSGSIAGSRRWSKRSIGSATGSGS